MKVVIDTNVLLATIRKQNFAFIREEFEWTLSTEILFEYEEKLTEFYSVETAVLVLGWEYWKMPPMFFFKRPPFVGDWLLTTLTTTSFPTLLLAQTQTI